MRRFIIAAAFLLALFAVCSSAFVFITAARGSEESLTTSIDQDVKQAIQKNQNARSYQEWRSSGYHPADIFKLVEDLNSKEAWGALCQALSKLKSRNLAIFDQEIRLDPKRRDGFSCGDELKRKLQRYWSWNDTKLAEYLKAHPVRISLASRTLSSGKKGVSFSISGGPHVIETPRVLQILKEKIAAAVFFEDPKEVHAHPEITRSIQTENYPLGFTGGHPVLLSTVNLGGAEEEIRRGRDQIYSAAGVSVSAFLLPVGANSSSLRKYIQKSGFSLVDPDFDPEDWKHRDAVSLFKRILAEIEMQPAANIMLHDRFEQTVIVLRQLIGHGE